MTLDIVHHIVPDVRPPPPSSLRHAGFAFSDTLFVWIYLTKFERDFAGFNAVYARYFPQAKPLPSRTTVGVAALGRQALVEVDMVCFKPPG